MDAEARALRARLLELMDRGATPPLPDGDFDVLARRVFAFQCAANPAYGAYAAARGRPPDAVTHWTAIPGVPTAAFRELPLVSGDPAAARAVFRTSGTTAGQERRGEHHVLDLELYHRSLLSSFEAFILPDGARPRMLALLPPPPEQPRSSLGHMVGEVVARLGAPGSGHFAHARGDGVALDEPGLDSALEEAAATGEPVCLLGTSFSFVHWLDSLRDRGVRHRCPPGSRLMDTGGYKGRSRTVPAAELRALYEALLGLQDAWCVNEYGMTELLSQLYDGVLRDAVAAPLPGAGPGDARLKQAPAWLRTVAVDPETLAPLPPGETGLLRHVDLANLYSVVAVQTEDLGTIRPGGLELLGRAPAAAPRGCSIAMDDLLSATRRVP